MNAVCNECLYLKICEKEKTSCKALNALYKIGQEQDRAAKEELIRQYARDIGVFDYEVSPELQQLGEQVISKMPELSFLSADSVRIGYVISYKAKRQDGKITFADCRKVETIYQAYLPFDFVVTFYEPNVAYMTDNQKKVLLLHELKHIGYGPKGLRIEPHDIEDFHSILVRYGLNWNGFGQDVPDILAGGEEDEWKKNPRSTGRRG